MHTCAYTPNFVLYYRERERERDKYEEGTEKAVCALKLRSDASPDRRMFAFVVRAYAPSPIFSEFIENVHTYNALWENMFLVLNEHI